MRTALRGESSRSVALLVLFVALSLGISVADVWHYDHGTQPSLFELSNLVGPTAQSVLAGGGISVCTEAMGTEGNPVCFHAGRMPLATWMVALGIRLLGDDALRVNLLKTVLLLVPLEIAAWLAWLRAGSQRFAVMLLLLAPFGITVFLSDVRLMQVEEGYSYSLLALAVAILLFEVRPGVQGGLGLAAVFGLAVDGVYLAKSSMLPLVAVLVLGHWLLERRTAARVLVLVLAVAAPMGWAIHQHRASGRYTLGTSMDGLNLRKGNNAQFLEHYPPPAGNSLDDYDSDLNAGQNFPDEWSFDDFHRHAAVEYMKTHPRETLAGDGRKLWVAFFSVHKIGSSAVSGVAEDVEMAGLVVFRVLLWVALVGSVYWMVRRWSTRAQRLTAGIFLALVAACVLPYVAGFAYTRHVSVLIYPAALMCCWMLQQGTRYEVRGSR